MTDHDDRAGMVFAVETEERSLWVFASEADAIAKCEGLDVEAATWLFWTADGAPLVPEFITPNQRGWFWVGSGSYRLIKASPDHHADLVDALDEILSMEPNPFFSSLEQVRAHIVGAGEPVQVPEAEAPCNDGEGAPLPMAPRWLEIGVGLALMPFTLLCLVGSVMMVAWPPEKAPILSTALGLIFVLTCMWVLAVSVRLVFNRPRHGGLLGPSALRASAMLFLALPIGGVFTGHYRAFGLVAVGQAICYVVVALTLWSLAGRRTRQG